jgi:hypothetical protein
VEWAWRQDERQRRTSIFACAQPIRAGAGFAPGLGSVSTLSPAVAGQPAVTATDMKMARTKDRMDRLDEIEPAQIDRAKQ